jgi:hypothetical protein
MDFAPLEYVIPGYVVEGLTVLGGKPKLGKNRGGHTTRALLSQLAARQWVRSIATRATFSTSLLKTTSAV